MQLRGPGVRDPVGHAVGAGSPAVSACGVPGRAPQPLRRDERRIHVIFREYTPLVEGISLDEAFLDVTGATRLFGPATEIAAAIRARVATELGLACSVGVAPVKFLAKLASEAAKPRASLRGVVAGAGVVVVEPGQELRFLHPLPIESLWGVGPATAARLRRLGVTTVGELAAVPADVLEAAVGRAHGSHLGRLAHGIDERSVEPDREVKSVSHEETYPVDRYDRRELGEEIVRMADSVASRMRRAGVVGRTVTLKVRFGDFVTRTRSRSHPESFSDGPVDRVDGHRSPRRGRREPGRTAAGCRRLESHHRRRRAGGADAPRPRRPGRPEAARCSHGDAPLGPWTRCGSGSGMPRWAPPPCSDREACGSSGPVTPSGALRDRRPTPHPGNPSIPRKNRSQYRAAMEAQGTACCSLLRWRPNSDCPSSTRSRSRNRRWHLNTETVLSLLSCSCI